MVYEILWGPPDSNPSALLGRHGFVLKSPGLQTDDGPPMSMESKQLAERLAAAKVVVVDDEHYMRKVVRTMLLSVGVQNINIHDAPDGPAGLDLICAVAPNVVILDWQMPGLDGPAFVRMVRSPATFPFPDVPIIMLTGHGERSRVVEAVKIGVNEFLLKPVSVKALQDRMVSVLTKPREVVKSGAYYGPVPRKLFTAINVDNDQAIVNLSVMN
jgi:two-component system, chemotaxis family, chemotaxis protein CheY